MRGIDYVENVQGPTVCSFPVPTARTQLGGRSRSTWLRPAGWSAPLFAGTEQQVETRTRDDFGMLHEVRIVETAAHRAGGQVHRVGHSFGGTVALAAALGGTLNVTSLSLFETNPLALLREPPNEVLHQVTYELSRQFEAAVDEQNPDAADARKMRRTVALMPANGSTAVAVVAAADTSDLTHLYSGYQLVRGSSSGFT